ncbi:MAG: hypothetical protein ACOCX3_02550 [Chloroflexota bacterium]
MKRVVISAIMLVFAAGMAFVVSAATVSNFEIIDVVDSGNCAGSSITFRATVTGTTDDSGGLGMPADLLRGEVYDANGTQITAVTGGAPIGTTDFELTWTGPVPSPLPPTPYRAVLVDTNLAGDELAILVDEPFEPGDFIASCGVTPSPAAPPPPADITFSVGGDDIAVFIGQDSDGNPALNVYGIDDNGSGTFLFQITRDMIDSDPSTEPIESEGKVEFYVLPTGEWQLNIGPDDEGKVQVIIFNGLPPTNIYGYTFTVTP